jgi:hypothetical protein
MKHAISAILLTMFLTAGCDQSRMTQFEYGDIRLAVSGQIIQGSAISMADYKPGIYYSSDAGAMQVLIEVKLMEVNRDDLSILGVTWFDGTAPLIAATNLRNTTPKKSPPLAMGGLVNIGIGGGRSGGSSSGCPHGPGCTKCGTSRSGGGTSGGINFPVIVGREGEESKQVTSVSATFNLDTSVDIEDSYLSIEIQTGVKPNGQILIQPLLLPMRTLPDVNPPETPVKEATTTVLIRDDQTIVIDGLLKDEVAVRKKTPILSDIPLLGKLFKSNSPKTIKRNLLIFVTPLIILNEECGDNEIQTTAITYARRVCGSSVLGGGGQCGVMARLPQEIRRLVWRQGGTWRNDKHFLASVCDHDDQNDICDTSEYTAHHHSDAH